MQPFFSDAICGMRFDIFSDVLLSFSVSTPVSDSIVAKRVYKKCPISLSRKVTNVKRVELGILYFDFILSMDWLCSCYAFINWRTQLVKFQFPNDPILEREGGNFILKCQFVYCFKARKLISKCCIYHLIKVRDIDFETSMPESVPFVNEFLEVFPDDLPDISLEKEIDFGINLLPDTLPIFIPP